MRARLAIPRLPSGNFQIKLSNISLLNPLECPNLYFGVAYYPEYEFGSYLYFDYFFLIAPIKRIFYVDFLLTGGNRIIIGVATNHPKVR